jgi:hypothetical protein
MTRPFKYILIAALMLALSGCGYSVKRSSVDSVRIGEIENMTSEARLDDSLTEALVSAFMKNGIKVDRSSEYVLTGTLESLELAQLSEVNEVTTSYQVIITGKFFLVRPDREKSKLPGGGKFIVRLSSTGPLATVIANKELAIEQALSDFAEEISAEVLYMK